MTFLDDGIGLHQFFLYPQGQSLRFCRKKQVNCFLDKSQDIFTAFVSHQEIMLSFRTEFLVSFLHEVHRLLLCNLRNFLHPLQLRILSQTFSDDPHGKELSRIIAKSTFAYFKDDWPQVRV